MIGDQLFGSYSPGNSIVHKTPLWVKGICLIALSIALMVTKSWWVALISLILLLLIGRASKIALATWASTYKPLLPLFAILVTYFLVMHQYALGANVLLTMLTLVTASKILLTTTPIPHIIDGFVKLCTPMKIIGVSPERIGLSIALMIRSIPVIMNEYTLIKQAHQARGLTTWPHKLLIPLVIATIAYAEETGDALAARGLDQL